MTYPKSLRLGWFHYAFSSAVFFLTSYLLYQQTHQFLLLNWDGDLLVGFFVLYYLTDFLLLLWHPKTTLLPALATHFCLIGCLIIGKLLHPYFTWPSFIWPPTWLTGLGILGLLGLTVLVYQQIDQYYARALKIEEAPTQPSV